MFWVFLAVVVLIILVGATYYNALSSKRGRCDEAWRELRARLDRRGALIDTLCETLRSATQGQEATIEKLQAARDAAADETDDVLQRVQAEHVVDEQFAAVSGAARQRAVRRHPGGAHGREQSDRGGAGGLQHGRGRIQRSPDQVPREACGSRVPF
jgi:hypothetical protein